MASENTDTPAGTIEGARRGRGPAAPPKTTDCTVWDKNATKRHDETGEEVGRVHDAVENPGKPDMAVKPYRLYATKPGGTKMPLQHALCFLRDPSFIVVDPDGNVMEMVKPSDAQTAGLTLQPGHVVASLRELTDKALLFRARGYQIAADKETPRDQLIALILQAEGAQRAGPDAEDDEGESGEAELDSDD